MNVIVVWITTGSKKCRLGSVETVVVCKLPIVLTNRLTPVIQNIEKLPNGNWMVPPWVVPWVLMLESLLAREGSVTDQAILIIQQLHSAGWVIPNTPREVVTNRDEDRPIRQQIAETERL